MSHSQNGNSTWRFQPLLIAVAFGVGVLAVLVAISLKGRVTHASFARIRIGMSRDELHALLGRKPDIQVMNVGKVNGPDNYLTRPGADPKELRGEGYQDYRFEQWTSAEVSIMVITDLKDQVVCRYSGEGQGRIRDFWNWLSAWFKKPTTSSPYF